MIRFVGNDAEGLPLKRKQSQRACEKCRKRKKRCPHQYRDQSELHINAANAESQSQPRIDTSSISSSKGELTGAEKHTRPQSRSAAQRMAPRPSNPPTVSPMSSALAESSTIVVDEDNDDHDLRFVGELNPESIFVTGACPAVAGAASSPEDVVGIWAPRRLADAVKIVPRPILPMLLPYLDNECSKVLPRVTDYDFLYKLYLDEFQPIFPIINVEPYQRQQDRTKLLLKLAICLCVVGNPKAVTHLGQTPKDFTNLVTQLLRSVIDNGLVRDKQIIMQLLVVLAMSTQLSDDRHASAEFTCRAVSYVHTGGFHHDTTNRNDDSYVTRLFCCIFVLDRLNAAVQGRPVLMHERDMGRDLNACIKQQDCLFQLLLRVIVLLDNIIALYRPSRGTDENQLDGFQSLDVTFPAFEDLLSTCGTIRTSAALVATVETLYHAVAMLSCRSQSLNELTRNSASHTRQSLSAASITSIAGSEYKGQLSVLPFVPYAMSLALRVSYRELRLSKSSFTRARARRQLLHVCSLLREFGDVFSSSIQMADLAEQIVREMDKAYTHVAGQRRASLAPAVSEQRPPEIQPLPATHHDQDNANIDESAGQVLPTISETFDLPSDYDMRSFDLAHFDFDLDIFDHFDPTFDIEAIDAALANGIDPSMPTNMISQE